MDQANLSRDQHKSFSAEAVERILAILTDLGNALENAGVELKEAFNQVKRYHKHSFAGTLFEYIQIFVISNGVNTKYFANNPPNAGPNNSEILCSKPTFVICRLLSLG